MRSELWCGTQNQSAAIDATARVLGIPRDRVKLNYLLLGGGFGRRGHADEEFIVDAVLLSKEVRRPVKVLWSRDGRCPQRTLPTDHRASRPCRAGRLGQARRMAPSGGRRPRGAVFGYGSLRPGRPQGLHLDGRRGP